ncbi:MAG: PQQ-binding-like beta-propeller repeat protein [Thermoplasmatales archaeon]|nr:MAG: PQQ-binding-like beta-propeller repeat protein [Thermoplasmatales archaeon]
MKRLYCTVLIITLLSPTFFTVSLAENEEIIRNAIGSGRYGEGYRYNTHGWIYLYIEGKPYERGYQHGYLLADEIVDHIQRWAHIFPQKWSWKLQRFNAKRFFWNKYPKEYQQEIIGIADGCADRGGKIYDKPISFKDILALNEMYEMLSRFRNYNVYPLRFTNYWLFSLIYNFLSSKLNLKSLDESSDTANGKCSAFIATGDATVDGRIVASHTTRSFAIDNLWWHMYITERWNVMLDIKPSTGYRILMSTAPGMIWSDEDYYQNEAGMILMETTLPLGIWNRFGTPLVVRARKAIQYSDSIDEMVNYFIIRNNGLFANEWIIGDTKTGEIATLELALFNYALKKTKNGFYWSVNAPRDDKVRWELSSILGLGLIGRILKLKYKPQSRDVKFEEYSDKYYGKIDVDIARKMMSTFPICDVLDDKVIMFDCKVTDTQLVKDFGVWTFMGNPGGVDFPADEFPIYEERDEYTDLPACGWLQLFGRKPSSVHRKLNQKSKIGETGKKIWEFQTDEGEIGNAIYSSMVSDGEKLYFTSWNGFIYVLDIETGRKIWEKNLGWSSESTPIIVDKKVIVGSTEGLFVFHNGNGEIIWKNEIGSVSVKPQYYDGIVYCGSHNGILYAFDLETGDVKWIFETNGEIHSSPVVERNVLYFGSNDGYLYAIDTRNKDLKWKFGTDGPVVSSPLVFDNVLYFGSWDSNLHALEVETGKLKWKFTAGWGIDSSPAFYNDTIYIGSEDNNFYAIDAKDGNIKWMFTTNGGIRSSPTVYGNFVFFGSSDGIMYALNALNGNLEWSIALDYYIDGIYNYKTRPIVSSSYVDDGKVYVGSTNGKIYCFNAQTFKPPEPIKKKLQIPVETWLFLVISLLFVIYITVIYLVMNRRKNS